MDRLFAKSAPVWHTCKKDEFSFFFDLVDSEWEGEITKTPLHRVCSLMRKMDVAFFLREDLLPAGEIAEEVQALALARGENTLKAEAIRFTFFRAIPGIDDWEGLRSKRDEAEKALLGYAVLLKVFGATENGGNVSYILEAVVRTPSKWRDALPAQGVCNYYVHCSRSFPVTVGEKADGGSIALKVWGSFFAQQNGITHVCAHAALRSALHSSPSYDFEGNKLTNGRINTILDLKPGVFENDPDGLNHEQMIKVVKAMGWSAHSANFEGRAPTDYQSFVYPLIESGFSVILGLSGEKSDHVVTIHGHTLNTDRWPLERERRRVSHISTAEWADHFIAQDDNFGMYITLPTDDIRSAIGSCETELVKLSELDQDTRRLWADNGHIVPTLKAVSCLGVVPANVVTLGYRAELLAMKFVSGAFGGTESSNRWFQKLKSQLPAIGSDAKNSLVCRTLSVEARTYAESIRSSLNHPSGEILAKFEACFPSANDRVWVTELTLADLYTGNKRKLGDVVLRANATNEDYQKRQAVAFAWLPGIAWFGQKWRADVEKEWPITSHIPLLRGITNPGCQPDEW